MKVRATTTGRHLVFDLLYVQGRLEVQWEPGGSWLKIVVANYEINDWQLTLLVWGVAASSGAFDFEHVDYHGDVVSEEETSGSNA